jgi:hypothetical protein
MNDDATLTALSNRLSQGRDPLGGVHMTTPVSVIFAGASRRRGRRALAGAGAVCAAIVLALTLAFALALPSANPARPVSARLAAWSVDTNANGTVSFTLENTTDAARLQRVLAQAGIPALVRWGEVCLAQGRQVLLPTQGIVKGPAGSVFLLMGRGVPVELHWSWTITPARIPSGARFVISEIPSAHVPAGDIQAEWEFVPASAHVTCAKSMKP